MILLKPRVLWIAQANLRAGRDRVFRGGSWNFFGRYCRSAYRNRYDPGNRYYNLSFRLVLRRET